MGKASLILITIARGAVHLSLDPSPVDHLTSKIRSAVYLQPSQILYWDDPSPTHPERIVQPTCNSLDGPICAPLAQPHIASVLMSHRGLVINSLYRQRMMNLLRSEPPPKMCVDGDCDLTPTTEKWLEILNEVEEIDHSQPSSSPYAGGWALSELLKACEFSHDMLAVPLKNIIVRQPSGDGRHYTLHPDSHEAQVLTGRIAYPDRAYSENDRYWYVPGAAVSENSVPSNNLTGSTDPIYIINQESYAWNHLENPQTLPVQFESTLGFLSPQLKNAINEALPSTVTQVSRSYGIEVEPEYLSAPSDFAIQNSSWYPWIADELFTEQFGQELKNKIEEEVALLNALPTDAAWWIYAKAMGISMESVRLWSTGYRPPSPKPNSNAEQTPDKQHTRSLLHPLTLLKGYYMVFYKLFQLFVYLVNSLPLTFISSQTDKIFIDSSRFRSPTNLTELEQPKADPIDSINAETRYAQTLPNPIVKESFYGGKCWSWDLPKWMPDNVQEIGGFGFSIGLPYSQGAFWHGKWYGPGVFNLSAIKGPIWVPDSQQNNEAPVVLMDNADLLSNNSDFQSKKASTDIKPPPIVTRETARLTFEKPIIVERLVVKVWRLFENGTLDVESKSLEDLGDLFIVGSSKSTVWSAVVKLGGETGGQPFTALSSANIEIAVAEVHSITFSWLGAKWAAVELLEVRANSAARRWVYNFDALRGLSSREIAARIRKAELEANDYPTTVSGTQCVALVAQSTPLETDNLASPVGGKVKMDIRAHTENELQNYLGSKFRGNDKMDADADREIAQLTELHSETLSRSRALNEGSGALSFATGDGVVLRTDMRASADSVALREGNLPSWSPFVSLESLHRMNAQFAYKLDRATVEPRVRPVESLLNSVMQLLESAMVKELSPTEKENLASQIKKLSTRDIREVDLTLIMREDDTGKLKSKKFTLDLEKVLDNDWLAEIEKHSTNEEDFLEHTASFLQVPDLREWLEELETVDFESENPKWDEGVRDGENDNF